MTNLRAIIFDMDGLMIDTEKLYFAVEREMASEYGKTAADKTLWKMMGRNPLEACSILVQELALPVSPQDFLDERDKRMLDRMKRELDPMPGLFEILKRYHGRLKLAIATGARSPFLNLAIDSLGIRASFEVLQSSDEIRHGKPDPEIYSRAVERLGLKPADCVVLEDSENGSRAGKSAGCKVIAVPSEYTRGQDFSMADFVAENLFQAAEFIEKEWL